MGNIPVSILITTRNEEQNIGACLQTLDGFDDVIVIDSNSTDRTQEIVRKYDAKIYPFSWNGQYPKKRQWVLDHIKTKYNYIFWLDADERVTPAFKNQLKNLSLNKAGYFVSSCYVWNDKILKHGLKNTKLAIMHREKFIFPVVDDLDIEGMGEIEGHYQPVLKEAYKKDKIGVIATPYLHDAYCDADRWHERHQRYALWEAQMRQRKAYPKEDLSIRRIIKKVFNVIPLRHVMAFLHSYIFKLGFIDGQNGYDFARSRAHYYKMVKDNQERLVRQ